MAPKEKPVKKIFSALFGKKETPETAESPRPDWKQQVLEDFSAWLGDLPDKAPPSEKATAEACDLYTLLSEFSALRQEIKMQNREQHKNLRALSGISEAWEKSANLFEKSVERIDRIEPEIRQNAEKKAVLPFLDVRDALVRGHQASLTFMTQKRRFRRKPKGIAAIAEGYEMAIRRFDRALEHAGITPVQTIDHMFDPKTMKAVDRRSDPDKTAGVVLAEQTGGFQKDGEIIRTAQVIVNEPQKGA